MLKQVLIWTLIATMALGGEQAFARGGGGRGGGGFHGGGFGGGGFGGGGFHGGNFGGAGGFHGGNFGGGEFRGGNFGGAGEFRGGGMENHPINRSPSMSMPRGGEFNRGGSLAGNSFGGDRINFGSNRPTAGAMTGNRLNFGDRPGGAGEGPIAGNRPGIENRPGNLRPNVNAITNIHPTNINNFNRNFNNNNFNHNFINNSDWHHGYWHGNWNNWNNWGYHPAAWWWGGAAVGMLGAAAIPWGWGYWPYYNPYAGAYSGVGYNYSQPILAQAPVDGGAVAAQAPADGAVAADTPALVDAATDLFESARQAFMQGDYSTALAKTDQAITQLPNDPTLHEFRGVVLFATKQYQQAAAAIYAVLSGGPGWDWTTLSSLYPDIEVYTAQLRTLEAYRRQQPDEADARFLLAYFYMTSGQNDAAANELKSVVKLNPQDKLSAQLLAGIEPAAENQQPTAPVQPAAPASPAAPVAAATLVGNWKANQPDGTTISLDLAKDSKYTWKVDRGGQTQDFTGGYTVADNLLVLNQNNTPMMVGQVTQMASNTFNFKLPGTDTNDPGLTFKR